MYLKGANSMASSGLAVESHALVGTGWDISPCCMNWLREWSSGLVGPPFVTMTRFFSSVHWHSGT